MLDFIYMIPKLRVKMRQAVLRAKASDPKAQANGYCHTYFDNTGIDILTLATYPTDKEIDDVASEAVQEADSLVALLGLVPAQLHRLQQGAQTVTMPSISAWYSESAALSEGNDSEGDGFDDTTDSDAESLSEAQELQELIELEERNLVSRTKKQDDELMNLTCAALAITTNDLINV